MPEPFNPYAPPAEPQAELYQQVPAPDANLASPWRRLVAKLIDVALILGTVYAATLLAERLDLKDASLREVMLAALAPMAVALLALAGVQWTLTAMAGQTIGKKFMMTRVVKDDGTPAGFFAGVVLREWVMGLLAFVPYLNGILWLADSLFVFADDRKTLHDRIAGTKVIDARANPFGDQEPDAVRRPDTDRQRKPRRRRRKKKAAPPAFTPAGEENPGPP